MFNTSFDGFSKDDIKLFRSFVVVVPADFIYITILELNPAEQYLKTEFPN